MKNRLFPVLLSCLLLCGIANATTLENVPKWLNGTLCISTIGFEMTDDGNMIDRYSMEYDSSVFQRYIVFYNFADGNIEGIEVPHGTRLSEGLSDNGSPVVFIQAENGWSSLDGTESMNRRMYYLAMLSADPDSKNGWMLNYGTDTYYRYVYLENALEPIAIHGSDYCVYYLGYGVSQEGELEIQMICDTGEEKTVYAHFDLDSKLNRIHYSISEDGKFAWQLGDGTIHISDGIHENVVSGERVDAYGPCWLDNTNLLYFETARYYTSPYKACKINLQTGEAEYIVTNTGEILSLDVAPEAVIAGGSDGEYIIFLWRDGEWGLVFNYYITIFSVETGESYTFDPMPDSAIGEYPENGIVTFNDTSAAFFEFEDMTPRLVWMADK